MRTAVQETDYILSMLYEKLEHFDLSNVECSVLINGGPGLGKTTACLSNKMYELYERQLGKKRPKILLIESRSLVRDQQRLSTDNPNIAIYQYVEASTFLSKVNEEYDLVIIDEAHFLFMDSAFANAASIVAEWLRLLCSIPQIYITASDEEFVRFAERYFTNKELFLVFDDLSQFHYYHRAKEIILSISTNRLEEVISNKEREFFQLRRKGLFFVLSATQAYELSRFYRELGYSTAFYISKGNTTRLKLDLTPTLQETLGEVTDDGEGELSVQLHEIFKAKERQRREQGLVTLEEGLRAGLIPEDIDYLFLTDVGQEGLSLSIENNLDFIFIEDFYSLRINQKIFRYRGNIPFVYISLARKRLEKDLLEVSAFVNDVLTWSQEKLSGWYERGVRNKDKGLYSKLIYKDSDGIYKLAKNFLVFSELQLQENTLLLQQLDNPLYLQDKFGLSGESFDIEDNKAIGVERKILLVLDRWINVPLNKEKQVMFVEQCIEAGLRTEANRKDFKFLKCKKLLEERGWKFVNKRTSTEASIKYPYLQYRESYWLLVPQDLAIDST